MRFWTGASWAACLAILTLLPRVTSATDVHDDDSSDSLEAADPSPASGPKPQRPLRPALSVSERVIPVQLVDSAGVLRAPRRKHLRVSTLMAVLGQDLDPSRMAVDKPAVLIEGPDYGASAPPQAALRSLNLSQELLGPLPEGLAAQAEAWLLRRASCPLRYVWEDVGALFWPRWIKRGECVNEPRRSCSWPPGMHCVPAESAIVHLLRWHCRPRSRRSTQLPSMGGKMATGSGRNKQERVDHRHFRCQWLKVPYPVTDKCFCSC